MFSVFNSQKMDQGELDNGHVLFAMSKIDKEQWLKHIGINQGRNYRKVSRSKGDHSFYFRDSLGTYIQLATPNMW